MEVLGYCYVICIGGDCNGALGRVKGCGCSLDEGELRGSVGGEAI